MVDHDRRGGTIERFAASVLHDIRTPLSALSGEVEVAKRRERTLAEYREIVGRIGDRVSELVELTENLALLGNPRAALEAAGRTAPLAAAVSAVSKRFADTVEIVTRDDATFVVGDESLIARALTLLLQHALRHRHRDARVRLTVPRHGSSLAAGTAELLIDAPDAGFWPSAWQHLRDGDLSEVDAAAPVRLRTAAVIVHACGGAFVIVNIGGTEALCVRLRKAAGRLS